MTDRGDEKGDSDESGEKSAATRRAGVEEGAMPTTRRPRYQHSDQHVPGSRTAPCVAGYSDAPEGDIDPRPGWPRLILPLYGHGGDVWKKAAQAISQDTEIPLKSYYHDVYRAWHD